MDPKPPRPGLRAHWTKIGILCALLGSAAGRFFLRPSLDPPPPRPVDPTGDRLLDDPLLTSPSLDSLRQRATDSPTTQRRADEAATRTYADGPPAPDERRPPARRPVPPRPLRFTPAPLSTSTPPPALPPPRPLLFTPAPLPTPTQSPALPPPRPRTFTPAPTPAPALSEPALTVAAEVTDLTPLPDSIGNLYFIGLYHNTGEATIDLPRAELTLWSGDGQKLAAATGFTSRHQLPAGETTPLKVLFTKAPPYATMTVQVSPKRELFPRHRPQLTLSATRLERGRYAGYRVTGTAHNRGPTAAQYVQLIALLYDAQEHLVGLESRFTAQRLLPSGASTPFEVTVSLVRGVPKRVQLDYQALEAPAGTLQSR